MGTENPCGFKGFKGTVLTRVTREWWKTLVISTHDEEYSIEEDGNLYTYSGSDTIAVVEYPDEGPIVKGMESNALDYYIALDRFKR